MVLLVAWGCYFVDGSRHSSPSRLSGPITSQVSVAPANQAPRPALKAESPQMVVYVTGAVRHPGLYHLPLDARVDDVLRRAGGPTGQADLGAINLAAVVEDGMQVVVPALRSVLQDAEESSQTIRDLSVLSSSSVGLKSHTSHRKTKVQLGEHIPLNHASLTLLLELPGIGAKKAAAIMAYRHVHGLFTSLDSLRLVPGIGPKLLSRLLPFLTL